MVLWLQRQESVILFDGYLQWAASDFMPTESDLSSDTCQETTSTAASSNDSIDDCAAMHYGAASYYLPKSPPRPGVSKDDIISEFGATHFVSAIDDFVASATGLNDVKAHSSDLYDVYTQFKVLFPDCNLPNSYLPSQFMVERIHAHPSTSGSSSQRFDTILVQVPQQEGRLGTVHSEYRRSPSILRL
jgi:hypothetical protein